MITSHIEHITKSVCSSLEEQYRLETLREFMKYSPEDIAKKWSPYSNKQLYAGNANWLMSMLQMIMYDLDGVVDSESFSEDIMYTKAGLIFNVLECKQYLTDIILGVPEFYMRGSSENTFMAIASNPFEGISKAKRTEIEITNDILSLFASVDKDYDIAKNRWRLDSLITLYKHFKSTMEENITDNNFVSPYQKVFEDNKIMLPEQTISNYVCESFLTNMFERMQHSLSVLYSYDNLMNADIDDLQKICWQLSGFESIPKD